MKGKVWGMNQSAFSHIISGNRLTYRQCQSSSALGVNQEQSRNSSHDLDSTISEGSVQSLSVGVTNVREDSRTVERDNCKTLETSCCRGNKATYC